MDRDERALLVKAYRDAAAEQKAGVIESAMLGAFRAGAKVRGRHLAGKYAKQSGKRKAAMAEKNASRGGKRYRAAKKVFNASVRMETLGSKLRDNAKHRSILRGA